MRKRHPKSDIERANFTEELDWISREQPEDEENEGEEEEEEEQENDDGGDEDEGYSE